MIDRPDPRPFAQHYRLGTDGPTGDEPARACDLTKAHEGHYWQRYTLNPWFFCPGFPASNAPLTRRAPSPRHPPQGETDPENTPAHAPSSTENAWAGMLSHPNLKDESRPGTMTPTGLLHATDEPPGEHACDGRGCPRPVVIMVLALDAPQVPVEQRRMFLCFRHFWDWNRILVEDGWCDDAPRARFPEVAV